VFINSSSFLSILLSKEIFRPWLQLSFVEYFGESIFVVQGRRFTFNRRLFLPSKFSNIFLASANLFLSLIINSNAKLVEITSEIDFNLFKDAKLFNLLGFSTNNDVQTALNPFLTYGSFFNTSLFYLTDIIDSTLFFSYKHRWAPFFVTSFFPTCFFSDKLHDVSQMNFALNLTYKMYKKFNIGLLTFNFNSTSQPFLFSNILENKNLKLSQNNKFSTLGSSVHLVNAEYIKNFFSNLANYTVYLNSHGSYNTVKSFFSVPTLFVYEKSNYFLNAAGEFVYGMGLFSVSSVSYSEYQEIISFLNYVLYFVFDNLINAKLMVCLKFWKTFQLEHVSLKQSFYFLF